jgi:hypothetical protein
MTYTIEWSGSEAEVTTTEEADAVLNRIAAEPRAYLVHVIPPGNTSVLEVVWGHPERAMVMYADDEQGGWGLEPSLPPLVHDLNYDHGSIEPDRTRVSVAAARQAVREYITTGRQPTNLSWFDE